MRENKAKTSISQYRTIDYSPTSWEFYKDKGGEIFKWDEKKDGEPQLGIRINQTQRTGFITPVDQYGFKAQDLDLYFKGVYRALEMGNDGDDLGYSRTF